MARFNAQWLQGRCAREIPVRPHCRLCLGIDRWCAVAVIAVVLVTSACTDVPPPSAGPVSDPVRPASVTATATLLAGDPSGAGIAALSEYGSGELPDSAVWSYDPELLVPHRTWHVFDEVEPEPPRWTLLDQVRVSQADSDLKGLFAF